MSDTYSSFGVIIKRGDGGDPEVFATIAGMKDVDHQDGELRTQESTDHGSTAGWVEVTPTLIDGGETTYKLNWDPAEPTHTLLRQDRDNRTLRNFQLVENVPASGETADFAALVTKVGRPYPVEGLLEADVTLRISGPITWT